MHMQKPSKLLPDDLHHLMATNCVLPQVASWGKGILSLATAPLGFFTKTSRFREVSATPDIKNITGCGF